MFLGKILLSIFIGLSGRTAKIQPNPADYQLKGGMRTCYADVEAKYEKEDGDYYRGFYFRSNPWGEVNTLDIFTPRFMENTYGEIKIDEADNINNQYVYKTVLNLDILRFRSTNYWKHWKEHKWLGGVELSFTTTQIITRIEYDTNLKDTHIGRVNLGYKYLINDVAYLMPSYQYETYDGNVNYKWSIEYGVDFVQILNNKNQKKREQETIKLRKRIKIENKAKKRALRKKKNYMLNEVDKLDLDIFDMEDQVHNLAVEIKKKENEKIRILRKVE